MIQREKGGTEGLLAIPNGLAIPNTPPFMINTCTDNKDVDPTFYQQYKDRT